MFGGELNGDCPQPRRREIGGSAQVRSALAPVGRAVGAPVGTLACAPLVSRGKCAGSAAKRKQPGLVQPGEPGWTADNNQLWAAVIRVSRSFTTCGVVRAMAFPTTDSKIAEVLPLTRITTCNTEICVGGVFEEGLASPKPRAFLSNSQDIRWMSYAAQVSPIGAGGRRRKRRR